MSLKNLRLGLIKFDKAYWYLKIVSNSSITQMNTAFSLMKGKKCSCRRKCYQTILNRLQTYHDSNFHSHHRHRFRVFVIVIRLSNHLDFVRCQCQADGRNEQNKLDWCPFNKSVISGFLNFVSMPEELRYFVCHYRYQIFFWEIIVKDCYI